ncbi:MAG: hypothetical protein OHK0015_23080 [Chloroflexi bacterium OHK40]
MNHANVKGLRWLLGGLLAASAGLAVNRLRRQNPGQALAADRHL